MTYLKHLIPSFLLLFSCSDMTENQVKNSTQSSLSKMDPYWYNGEAEISSYELSQARYGEMRKGKAVMVFVTEPFSSQSNTKSDRQKEGDVSVLKLNFTKNFNTGIYPYSMMNSTFFPFQNGSHSLKVSSSSQEWCGHTYMELRNRKKFEIDIHSYFEGESTRSMQINKSLLEDDIWSRIRLHPEELPTGNHQMIPSFFYLRLKHKESKAYKVKLSHSGEGAVKKYTLEYPDLDRILTISYEAKHPYTILGWTEEHSSGWGANKQKLITKASKIKTIKSAYWKKNANKDEYLRTELGL